MVGDTVYFDTLGKSVIAVDLHNGTRRWEIVADNVVMSTPIIAEGAVIVGTGHNGDMMSGHTASSFVYAAREGTTSLPMWGRVEGDHVIALDAATGAKRWSYRTAGEDMPSPAYVNGMLVFANGDFNAYGLRASDGDAAWQQDVKGLSTMASANLAGENVLLGVCSGPDYRGSTIALNAKTGALRWRAPAGDCDSAPTFGGGRVFVSGVDGNRTRYGFGARGTVAALDRNTGRIIWRYRTEHDGPYTKIGSNERAIAGTYRAGTYYQAMPTTNELIAFDSTTGAVRWRFHTNGPVKMSPVLKDRHIYFGDTVGLFYTLDSVNGALVKARMFEDAFSTSPPVFVGDTVVVAAGTRLYAFAP